MSKQRKIVLGAFFIIGIAMFALGVWLRSEPAPAPARYRPELLKKAVIIEELTPKGAAHNLSIENLKELSKRSGIRPFAVVAELPHGEGAKITYWLTDGNNAVYAEEAFRPEFPMSSHWPRLGIERKGEETEIVFTPERRYTDVFAFVLGVLLFLVGVVWERGLAAADKRDNTIRSRLR